MAYVIIYEIQCDRLFENKNSCTASLMLLLGTCCYKKKSKTNYHGSSVRFMVGLAA